MTIRDRDSVDSGRFRSTPTSPDSPRVPGASRLWRAISSDHRSFITIYCILAGALLWLAVSLVVVFQSEVSAAIMGPQQGSVAPSPGEMLVIDTDAGTDDAVAILTILGDPLWGKVVTGITCVRGNTLVENVEINVLKTLKIAGKEEVPVYRGSVEGFMYSPEVGEFFGKDGMGDANYPHPPPSATLVQKEHAAVYLANLVKNNPGDVTVLTLGPLTNIALALRLNPTFMHDVKRIVALGGAIKDGTDFDKRPSVEYNIYMDPDAASVVLRGAADAKREDTFFTMVPSETVHNNAIGLSWRINILGKVDSPKVAFMNRIEKGWLKGNYWNTFDVYAAVVLLRPDMVVSAEEVHSDIETEGRLTRGRLIADHLNVTKQHVNTKVILQINKSIIKDVLVTNLS